MIQIKSDNYNDLFANSIYQINEKGHWTKPRGFKCKEIIAPQLILTNPRNCTITIKERKLNYAYLIIEKMSYLTGIQNKECILAYNAQMKNYLNTSDNFDGAYGPRINGQLDWCYNLLKKDPDSRQAVITIRNESDCHETKDHPCTLSLHFILRDNKLHLITTMRSNDIKWGTCLDIPAFCFIQEVMAYWLNVELGEYIHQPASLHYYDNFEKELISYIKYDEELAQVFIKGHINDFILPEWNISQEETKHAISQFWASEKQIRIDTPYSLTDYDVLNEYLSILLKYRDSKKLRTSRLCTSITK